MNIMAGNSKEQRQSVKVYNTLQSLGCPLVDGLYLREADSMQELLCSPSLHRTDILKWIYASVCPSLMEKFSTIRTNEELIPELTRFGREMMLCKANDQDLIKGLAPPLRQLVFLEQLLMIVQADSSVSSGQNSSSGDQSVKDEDLLGTLMSQDHSSDLDLVLNPTCSPWSAHIREHLIRAQSSQNKMNGNHSKPNDCINGTDSQHSRLGSNGEDDLTEATALLQSTQSTLEELRKECEFLQSHPSGSAAALTPCALKVAISDMSQFMTAFSHVYNTDFKGYCQKTPPALSSGTNVFQSVHQLLQTCNMELKALKQLSETSSSVTQTVRDLQTDRRYWSKGEKRTLPSQLEELKNKYVAFLSLQQS